MSTDVPKVEIINQCTMQICKPSPDSLERYCVFKLGSLVYWDTNPGRAALTTKDCPDKITKEMIIDGYPNSGIYKP